jgi:tRNA threonylcarbamoyladenosine biosynthesis protein TsaE
MGETYNIQGSAEMARMAQVLLETILPSHNASIVALSGELGAGKTTFTQAMARELGVEGPVTSPTFVLEKIYKTSKGPFKHLIHIDCYRLSSADELRRLGFDDLAADPGNLILIEWPERVAGLFTPTFTLKFEVIGEDARQINISHG